MDININTKMNPQALEHKLPSFEKAFYEGINMVEKRCETRYNLKLPKELKKELITYIWEYFAQGFNDYSKEMIRTYEKILNFIYSSIQKESLEAKEIQNFGQELERGPDFQKVGKLIDYYESSTAFPSKEILSYVNKEIDQKKYFQLTMGVMIKESGDQRKVYDFFPKGGFKEVNLKGGRFVIKLLNTSLESNNSVQISVYDREKSQIILDKCTFDQKSKSLSIKLPTQGKYYFRLNFSDKKQAVGIEVEDTLVEENKIFEDKLEEDKIQQIPQSEIQQQSLTQYCSSEQNPSQEDEWEHFPNNPYAQFQNQFSNNQQGSQNYYQQKEQQQELDNSQQKKKDNFLN